VGGGLAGCEAALVAARAGLSVTLVEMKPGAYTPAHKSPRLAELVCSNSLRSDDPASGPGLLKAEMRRAGSAVMAAADACRVPAGGALAVDRERFSEAVEAAVAAYRSDIEAYFQRLGSETDPVAIARYAGTRPPFPVLELIGAGLPTVAYAAPGARSQLDKIGSLVPAGDVNAFGRRLVELLSLEREAYEAVSQLSAERAATYRWPELTRRTLEAYDSALAGRS